MMRRTLSDGGSVVVPMLCGKGSASLLRPLFILFLWLQGVLIVVAEVFQSEDYYCGESWADAAQICTTNCTSGEDSECVLKLGESFGCYGFTGCHAKLSSVELGAAAEQGAGGDTDAEDTADDVDADFAADAAASDGGTNNFCGQSWVGAMVSCSTPCPQSTECILPDRCFAATNCDKPIEQLVSEMITTLSGPDIIMELEDLDIFGGTVYDFIKELADVEGVSIGDVEPQEQTVVSRRILQDRAERRRLVHGHDRFLHYDITNITLRRLPVGSSALDVSMVVTGDYRPPPYLDLDVIAEESINRNGDKVVKSLQERGARQGRTYFDQVQGIETVRAADMTQRPTVAPTDDPTVHPSMMPSSSPSNVPSSIPSMVIDREIACGTGADLAISDSTTESYGYIFNMRTKIDAPVVLITGMDFYTQVTEEVNYQVWSRIGNFKDYKADKEGWDLIAMGTTLGRGVGRYTSIPEETFTPVDIPGGGGNDGVRAFYITLDTIDLAYKVADDDMSESDSAIWVDAPEIEVWEGEGVLSFERLDEPFSIPPLPDHNELMYWKSPRQFLGLIRYDRLPCKPFSAYGPIDDLPCPLIPTGSPTLPQPSQSPMTLSPSISPTTSAPVGTPTGSPFVGQTSAPTGPDTESPTVSKEPTLSPVTSEPTMAPLVPMRANIITKLRNVPERQMTDRESEKFIEILSAVLKRYAGTIMIVDGIDLWHQELTVVDAKEGYVAATNITNDVDEGNIGNSSVAVDGKQRDRRVRAYDSRPTGPSREKEEEKPQVPAMEVTLILRISVSNLPFNLLGSMASVTIQEHKHILIDLLQEQQVFYSFFRLVDGVESRVIDEVTFPPTDSPTSLAYFTEQQEILLALEEEDTGEDSGISLGENHSQLSFNHFSISIGCIFFLMSQNLHLLSPTTLNQLCTWAWVSDFSGAASLLSA